MTAGKGDGSSPPQAPARPLTAKEKIEAWKAGLPLESETPARTTATPEEFRDDVPSDLGGGLSESQMELDALLARVGIVEAYRRWCGKSTVTPGGRTEGIKVSCPNPSHPDTDPSAWLNTDKGTWYCGVCKMGGDAHDIAAWRFGFSVPGYKEREFFPQLREAMAGDLGWMKVSTGGASAYETEPEPATGSDQPKLSVVPEPVPEPEEEYSGLAGAPDADLFPSLDWRSLLGAESTFLRAYMERLSEDDLPEEFHFWNAMMGLACALGPGTVLKDRKPVHANLYICLLGHTGSGKTRSQGYIKQLLLDALPLDEKGDPFGDGVKWVKNPASGEVLIESFSRPVYDPMDVKRVMCYAPVKGLVDFPEMSALMTKANREGSSLDSALIDLYDRDPTFGTTSRTSGTVKAPDPYGCLMTTGQPRAFRKIVSQKDLDNGFLNRFLFIGGKEKRLHPTGGEEIDLTPLVPALARVTEWGRDQPEVGYSVDGAKAWELFFYGTVMPHVKADRSNILGRAVLTCKKLMLLLATDRASGEVDSAIVDQLKVVYSYLIRCYGVSTTQMMVTDESEIIDEIREVMLKHTDKTGKGGVSLVGSRGMSANDLRRYLPARFRKQNKLIESTLRTMEALGDIVRTEGKVTGPGRRAGTRYSLSEDAIRYTV